MGSEGFEPTKAEPTDLQSGCNYPTLLHDDTPLCIMHILYQNIASFLCFLTISDAFHSFTTIHQVQFCTLFCTFVLYIAN